MIKKFLLFFVVLAIFLMPQLAMAQLVTCGTVTNSDGSIANPCTFKDFFNLIASVYKFIVLDVATPLATLMIVIGGIMLLVSAGNPTTASNGKNMLKWSIIALILIWGSYLIIDTVLKTIGYDAGIQTIF